MPSADRGIAPLGRSWSVYSPFHRDEEEPLKEDWPWYATLPCGCRYRCLCGLYAIISGAGIALLCAALVLAAGWRSSPPVTFLNLPDHALGAGYLFFTIYGLACLNFLVVMALSGGVHLAARIWGVTKIMFAMSVGAVVGIGGALLTLAALSA